MSASPLYAGTAIVRNDLGAVAYEFMSGADQLGYIGGVVLPIFEVPLGVGQYPVVPLEALFTEVDDARGPTGDYNEVDWPFEMADYRCADRGLLGRVDDGMRNLYANVIQVEEITTRTVMARIMRRHELRAAALVEARAADVTVTVPWGTAATATPSANVEDGIAAMRLSSGLTPNAVAMSYTTFKRAMRTAEVKEAVKYTKSPDEIGGDTAQAGLLAAHLGVGRVVVGNALRNSAQKNKTVTLANIWSDDHVHLLNLSDGGQAIAEPVFGRTLLFTGDSPSMLTVETYRDEGRRSDMIRCRNNSVEKIIFAGAQYKLKVTAG
ncbi:hypothetical protein [uncultured Lamprocystis sp.]|jgi:hypothetical protein|uniref:hypothetical protein n=1 Tax=uncultured Lamprocystis sp. TaxID=543132 RepID=UPI0025F76B67|nr:hypothetical protein [uncultured Lamprocystis sp.]